MKPLLFVIPCFNVLPNLESLIQSLQEQYTTDWNAVFIDDMSTDGTAEAISKCAEPRISLVVNDEKKFALRNIIEVARRANDHTIVAVIDGDDQLCNRSTVDILKEAHGVDGSVVWTAHKWDINGMNVSREMPENVNPYQYQWCSSHLRTFDSSLLKTIPDSNFQDHSGKWFERGYDQALMLPLLKKSTTRKYVPEVCYLYKINSCSISDRDWAEKKQLQTVNFVRARGFLDV